MKYLFGMVYSLNTLDIKIPDNENVSTHGDIH